MRESFFTENNAAWWGALISTILLVKEIYNWCRTKPTFDVSFFRTTEPGSDDKIIIYNDSTKIFGTITVNLYSAPFKNSENITNHDIGRYNDYDIQTLNPLKPYTMHVPGDCKFRLKNEMKLFAEIYVLGRKTNNKRGVLI